VNDSQIENAIDSVLEIASDNFTPEDFKKAFEEYSGSKVLKIEIVPDPEVSGVYAGKVKMDDHPEPVFFLYNRYEEIPRMRKDGAKVTNDTSRINVDNFEEVEFETWPPISGELRFFV